MTITTATNWTSLASTYNNRFIGQRDLSLNNTIDQLTFLGISLNKVIFDSQGYTNTSLMTMNDFLEMKYSLFMLDLYWNHFTRKWQLCPAPFPVKDTKVLSRAVEVSWENQTYLCSPDFSIYDVFHFVEDYLGNTNVRSQANMVQFALNLKSLYPPAIEDHLNRTSNLSNHTTANATETGRQSGFVPSQYTGYSPTYLNLGNASLSGSLSALGSYSFTPSDLKSWRQSTGNGSRYPTQDTYLFTLLKRVFPFVLSNTLHQSSSGYNVSSADRDSIFFRNVREFTPWIDDHAGFQVASNISSERNFNSSNFAQWNFDTQFRIVVDDAAHPFNVSSVSTFLKSGFSAIINSTSKFNETNRQNTALQIGSKFSPASFWSWSVDAFNDTISGNPDSSSTSSTPRSLETYAYNDTWYETSKHRIANSCVSVTKKGWKVQNCYDNIRGICQHNSNPFSWIVTEDSSNYLEWGNSSSCPVEYKVGVPRSSLEQASLIAYLEESQINVPVWIDVNDITVTGCYVSGGPYANCPYQEAITTKDFIKNIAPSASVALLLILLIFFERIIMKTPIHSNRKWHWKKKIAEYYRDNDYEGVPL